MKQIKLLTILFLNTILFFSCKNENELDGELTKIGFEKTETEIPKGGGSTKIFAEKPQWVIYGCFEMIDGEKVYIKNELIEINEIFYLKDTVYGDWYSLYKKENTLTIAFSENTDESERTLWIDCAGPLLVPELLTITQK